MNRNINPDIFPRTFFILLFTLSGALQLNAQQQAAPDNRLLLSISPLALADIFDGASLRLGAEFKLHHNVALAIEGGPYLGYLPADKISPRGYIVKQTVKYYLNSQNRVGGRYIAAEFLFKDQDYEFKDSMATGPVHFEQQYKMSRTATALSVKYGDLINLCSRLILEWYCGAGLRYVQSRSSLTSAEEDAILEGAEYGCRFSEEFVRQTGNRFYPNIVVGLRIGCRIK